jgi:SOS-response transcriptional repressor LexA
MSRTASPWNQRDELLLATIRQLTERNGISPSLRELSAALGWLSTSYINEKLARLVRFGKIKRLPRTARGIVILEAPCRDAGRNEDPDRSQQRSS